MRYFNYLDGFVIESYDSASIHKLDVSCERVVEFVCVTRSARFSRWPRKKTVGGKAVGLAGNDTLPRRGMQI